MLQRICSGIEGRRTFKCSPTRSHPPS